MQFRSDLQYICWYLRKRRRQRLLDPVTPEPASEEPPGSEAPSEPTSEAPSEPSSEEDSIELVSSNTSAGQTITVPSGSGAPQSGDLLVLWDFSNNTSVGPTPAVPSGFTQLQSAAGFLARGILSYKISDGTEGGSTLTGMAVHNNVGKVLLVYRGSKAFSVVGSNSDISAGVPSAAVNSSGRVAPVLAIAGYGTRNVISGTQSLSVSSDSIPLTHGAVRHGVVTGDVPSSISATMTDDGTANAVALAVFDLTP